MLENESLQKMTSSVSYLLANDGLPQREYMRKAAVDGIITYSYSDENFLYKEPAGSKRWTDSFTTENPLRADKEQSMWIDKIFSYLDSITGVSFQRKDGSRGEIHLNFVPTNTNKYFKGDFTNGYEIDAVENVQWTGGLAFYNGYGQMYSFHNRKQYGGLDDIRDIQRAILESLGLTPPEGDANNPKYSWDNTLLSNNTGGLNSAGATFFMSSDDKAAVEELLGAGEIAFAPKKVKVHSQKYKEELMIGLEGVIDVFKIRSKGMILKVDEGTQYDDIGVIINNYNVPYIANFNPYEGDRIEIHRSLLDPKSPQDNGSKKLAKHFKKTKLKFEHIFGDIYNKNKNIYYNDAGKLIVDTNGIKEGVMTDSHKAGLNSQVLAFVDPVGPETDSFSGEWLSFFSDESSSSSASVDEITSPKKFKVKYVDKITNFNTLTDILKIDTDSFGIDNSATFAAGKNKKKIQKCAKKEFEFLYDEKKGGLYFNENGSDKGFGDGGIIAILKGAPDLTSRNLEFI